MLLTLPALQCRPRDPDQIPRYVQDARELEEALVQSFRTNIRLTIAWLQQGRVSGPFKLTLVYSSKTPRSICPDNSKSGLTAGRERQ